MHQPLEQRAKKKKKVFKKFLRKTSRTEIVKSLPAYHEEAVEHIDCLDCAACCKNYSPTFKPPDIKRISKKLGMGEGEFIETYLKVDEDGDYVVESKPCPFLGKDNHCGIYEFRPSDCARFPYTDEDVLVDKVGITLKNSTFCPIVFRVLDRLVSDLGD